MTQGGVDILARGKTNAMAAPTSTTGSCFFPQDDKSVPDAEQRHRESKSEVRTQAAKNWAAERAVLHRSGVVRGVAGLPDDVYFLSNDAKLHAIDMKTGEAKWVKNYERVCRIREGLRQSKDSNGYITTSDQ